MKEEVPKPIVNPNIDIRQILDENPIEAKRLSEKQIGCLNLWQQIINVIPNNIKIQSPLWGMEFNANYPVTGKSPHMLTSIELASYKGAFGKALKGLKKKEQLALLPTYATYKEGSFPKWKTKFILDVRRFLHDNQRTLQPLFQKLEQYPSSWQKLEWNCLNDERDIFKYLIQFRASGIRVKRTNYSPALVLTSTQIPIIGWEKRYITLKEAARLQQLDNIKLPELKPLAYRALGNAVNVRTVKLIAKQLLPKIDIDKELEKVIMTLSA